MSPSKLNMSSLFASLITSVSSAVFGSQDMDDINTHPHKASLQDALWLKNVLFRRFSLPLEIIDTVIDNAEYWPCTTTIRTGGDEIIVRGSRENQFMLRSYPLGYIPTPEDPTTCVLSEHSSFPALAPKPWRIPEGVSTEQTAQAIEHLKTTSQARTEHPCRKIVFTLKSRDQGWGGNYADKNTYKGSCTWFEVGHEKLVAFKEPLSFVPPIETLEPEPVIETETKMPNQIFFHRGRHLDAQAGFTGITANETQVTGTHVPSQSSGPSASFSTNDIRQPVLDAETPEPQPEGGNAIPGRIFSDHGIYYRAQPGFTGIPGGQVVGQASGTGFLSRDQIRQLLTDAQNQAHEQLTTPAPAPIPAPVPAPKQSKEPSALPSILLPCGGTKGKAPDSKIKAMLFTTSPAISAPPDPSNLHPSPPSFIHPLNPCHTHLIQKNLAAHKTIETHVVTWNYLDSIPTNSECLETQRELVAKGRGEGTGNGQFVRDLSVGDAVTVWAKARFPGWVNHVSEVKIDVYWAV